MNEKERIFVPESVEYNYAGSFTSRGEWIHPERSNETSELIVVTDGCFRLDVGGECFQLSPGSVIVIPPNIPHRGVGVTTERVAFYWLHCKLTPTPEREVIGLRERYPVVLLCRQILHYAERGFGNDIISSLMRVLLAEVYSQTGGDDTDDAIASRIREWIRINSDRTLTASQLSERFGYSEDYISRLLRAKCGHSLKSLISYYRVTYIKRLLLETEHTLAEVADLSGFSDYKLFLKFFKYHEGMTPTEFREVYYSQHTNNR